jgi:hypothetical protein
MADFLGVTLSMALVYLLEGVPAIGVLWDDVIDKEGMIPPLWEEVLMLMCPVFSNFRVTLAL